MKDVFTLLFHRGKPVCTVEDRLPKRRWTEQSGSLFSSYDRRRL